MKLEKKGTYNEFTWKGLTLGKLLAIENALEIAKSSDKLGPVGDDVLNFLIYKKLDTLDCFDKLEVI